MTSLPRDEILRWAASNPREARLVLAKPRAEARLLDFMELLWPIVEPSRRMIRGWPLEAMAAHLEAIADGRIRRLLICVPPGSSKSLLCNVFFPAWIWGPRNRPAHRFFSAAYAEDLTIRDNRRCMAIITSPEYQMLWGDRVHLDPDQKAKVRFALKETGWKLATSVGGTGTGERADCVIIDDPLSAKEVSSDAALAEALQWFTEVIPTRVNEYESAIVVIMQRLHERDVAGHILSNDLGYDRLILPMEYEPDHPHPSRTALGFKDPRTIPGDLLWPERFSREQVEQDKVVLRSWGGEYAVASQFMQRPAPRGGGMFKRDAFRPVLIQDVPSGEDVRGWDLAASKDGRAAYTVGLKMRRSIIDGRPAYFVTDVVRGRLSPGEVRSLILRTAESDGRGTLQDLPQDPGQAGLAQRADLAQLLDGYSFVVSTESGSKEDRARPLAAQVEAGTVHVVRAAWTDQLLSEVASFPAGAYKDQVDAMSRAYSRLLRRQAQSVGASPVVVHLDAIE